MQSSCKKLRSSGLGNGQLQPLSGAKVSAPRWFSWCGNCGHYRCLPQVIHVARQEVRIFELLLRVKDPTHMYCPRLAPLAHYAPNHRQVPVLQANPPCNCSIPAIAKVQAEAPCSLDRPALPSSSPPPLFFNRAARHLSRGASASSASCRTDSELRLSAAGQKPVALMKTERRSIPAKAMPSHFAS